jgi:hypothetical protein
MKTFAEFWKTIAQTLKSSPRQSPSIVTIPRNHIDENQDGSLDVPFKRDQHYFVVMISEMYLANERKWLNAIDPLVYVVSEFTYEGKPQVVPYLVGPAMMKRLGVPDQYADGIMFRNTNVSGVRPYRGGGLTLTIVLCEAKGDNYLRSVLQVVESTASALDFSPALSPYAKVASVVLDGFESLFNSGAVSPLVGLRDSFGPNFQIPFRPGYFALIDQSGVDPQGLWVRDKQLLQGRASGEKLLRRLRIRITRAQRRKWWLYTKTSSAAPSSRSLRPMRSPNNTPTACRPFMNAPSD